MIALSAIAVLAAADSSGTLRFSATKEIKSGSVFGRLNCEDGWRALAPRTPAVLPLLPLLASIAARDQEGVESALKRLDRRLACPLSCAADGYPCAGSCGPVSSGTAPWGHVRSLPAGRKEDSHGGGSIGASSIGMPSSVSASCCGSDLMGRWLPLGSRMVPDTADCSADCSGSGRSAVSSATIASSSLSSGMSSLRAARQAEEQILSEQEGCKAAAVRLCGCGMQLYTQHPRTSVVGGLTAAANAVEAEGEGVRAACMAALAAAAADVRCHQVLLESCVLGSLPQLLRGAGTAPYAVMLVHNLAAPPSALFRDKLRRRGLLLPLLEYAARLTAPEASPGGPKRGGGPPAGGSCDLRSLAIALTALACLSHGTDGTMALQTPQLRAHRRLLALRERLAAWGCRNSADPATIDALMSPPHAPQRAQQLLEDQQFSQRRQWQHCSVDGLPQTPPPVAQQVPGTDANLQAAGVAKVDSLVRRLLRTVGGPVEREAVATMGMGTPPLPPRPRDDMAHSADCGPLLATPGSVGPTDPGGAIAPHQHRQAPDGASGTSMSFQSQVLVDGRPLQLTSVITRTSARRPDGTMDVQYHFQDQVSPGPALPCRHDGSTGPSPPGPARTPPPAPCYRSSSTWLHTGMPVGPMASDATQIHDRDQQPRYQTPHTEAISGYKALQDEERYGPVGSGRRQALSPTPSPCKTPGAPGMASADPKLNTQAQSPLALLAEHAGQYLSWAADQRRRTPGQPRPAAT